MSNTLRPAGDNDPVVMTAEERSVWVYLIAVVVTFIVYLAIMVVVAGASWGIRSRALMASPWRALQEALARA